MLFVLGLFLIGVGVGLAAITQKVVTSGSPFGITYGTVNLYAAIGAVIIIFGVIVLVGVLVMISREKKTITL
jgi:hypothetical protein